MRNLIILFVVMLGVTACVKQSDFENYQEDVEIALLQKDNQIAQLQMTIDELTAQLADNVATLQEQIDDNEIGILENYAEIVSNQINIAGAWIHTNSVSATLNDALIDVAAEFEATEAEFIALLAAEVEYLENFAIAGDIANNVELQNRVDILRREIAAAQEAAQAYADVNDDDTVFSGAAALQESISAVDARVDQVVETALTIDQVMTAINGLNFVNTDALTAAVSQTLADAQRYADDNDDNTHADLTGFVTIETLTTSLTTIQDQLDALPTDLATTASVTAQIEVVQDALDALAGFTGTTALENALENVGVSIEALQSELDALNTQTLLQEIEDAGITGFTVETQSGTYVNVDGVSFTVRRHDDGTFSLEADEHDTVFTDGTLAQVLAQADEFVDPNALAFAPGTINTVSRFGEYSISLIGGDGSAVTWTTTRQETGVVTPYAETGTTLNVEGHGAVGIQTVTAIQNGVTITHDIDVLAGTPLFRSTTELRLNAANVRVYVDARNLIVGELATFTFTWADGNATRTSTAINTVGRFEGLWQDLAPDHAGGGIRSGDLVGPLTLTITQPGGTNLSITFDN